MGDQIGKTVEGTLYYFSHAEFERVRAASLTPHARAALFADMCRLNALYMIARAGSGHIGSSFSSMDIMSWLLLEELQIAASARSEGDLFFSSKGHDAPALYAVLTALGRMPFDLVHKLRRLDGLPGHPDVATGGIVTNTGSLGMGISKAKGLVFANRLAERKGRVVVMTGDGELQEGQLWESLLSAANHGMHEILMIVDHNKLQSDTFVKQVSDLGDLEAKFRAFGWRVERCDGHDIAAFAATLAALRGERRPQVIIADTVKGRGVKQMEHTSLDSDVAMYRFHSGAPDAKVYASAVNEISARLIERAHTCGLSPLSVEKFEIPKAAVAQTSVQRLIPAYTRALLQQAEHHSNLVVLDADLALDTGLIEFRDAYPQRFFECGIAEQDMVSVAGGMALRGLLPVVHSFACFLSARPNEQIYNNATENTRIVYVGSLAGVVPGGPGHSHQAVRDISALAAVPGMTLLEPSCEQEVAALFAWCVNEAPGSSYLRLMSLPWDIPYQLPADYRPQPGRGVALTQGSDVVIIGYGPVLLAAAVHAARVLHEHHGLSVKVINLPWLNRVDGEWLSRQLAGYRAVFSLDNHYRIGGQGSAIADALAGNEALRFRLHRIAIDRIPVCGTHAEVLAAHGLDTQSILARVLAEISVRQ